MIRINMDAFSHSWKSMFAHLWPNISPALCIMVQLVPHKEVPWGVFCYFQKRRLFLALHLKRQCRRYTVSKL